MRTIFIRRIVIVAGALAAVFAVADVVDDKTAIHAVDQAGHGRADCTSPCDFFATLSRYGR